MRFRSLHWLNESGRDLALAVVNEHDIYDIKLRHHGVAFKCDDKTMVSIISALRDAINVTITITAI